MDNRQSILDRIWQSLQPMNRMKLNGLLSQMGLSKNMFAKMDDTQAKKLFLGLATRLDDTALKEVLPLVQV